MSSNIPILNIPILSLKIVSFHAVEDREAAVITFSDGTKCEIYHEQECCEWVGIEQIDGDPASLVGSVVRSAYIANGDESRHGFWTFIHIRCDKGDVCLRWYSQANYYSHDVDVRVTHADGSESLRAQCADEFAHTPIVPTTVSQIKDALVGFGWERRKKPGRLVPAPDRVLWALTNGNQSVCYSLGESKEDTLSLFPKGPQVRRNEGESEADFVDRFLNAKCASQYTKVIHVLGNFKYPDTVSE